MSHTAFAAVAPNDVTGVAAATAVNDEGSLWGIVLPGARAVSRVGRGAPWLLIVSEEWASGEEDDLGDAIPEDWPTCCAAGSGSDMLALGEEVSYLAALLGVGQ